MALKQTISILGGDTRQLSLAAKIAAEGFLTRAYGLPHDSLPPAVERCANWRALLSGASVVVLPLPASPDGRRVNFPLAPEAGPPLLDELFEAVERDTLITGGKFSPAVKAMAEERGICLFDYFESDELQVKNALPTAEGAVSHMMREIPRTVSGLPVAVTGYGRVSRALSDLLLAMGADVTVAARKKEDVFRASARGCRTVHLTGEKSIFALCRGQSVIFNTVPCWLFSREVLAEMSRDTLIIDLASAPGGVDADAAGCCGIRVIWALSLPGKYAPVTAGEIIADTVLSYIRKEGIV
jgi:dipicolinate synthase subunit A